VQCISTGQASMMGRAKRNKVERRTYTCEASMK
jgi:hypothetical protein